MTEGVESAALQAIVSMVPEELQDQVLKELTDAKTEAMKLKAVYAVAAGLVTVTVGSQGIESCMIDPMLLEKDQADPEFMSDLIVRAIKLAQEDLVNKVERHANKSTAILAGYLMRKEEEKSS